eukprot:Gb_18614 [translate_table: standard]
MEEADEAIDIEQSIQKAFNEARMGSRVHKDLSQIQHEWIRRDLSGVQQMEVEPSQGHGEIHLIESSHSIPLVPGSGGMVNSTKDEDTLKTDVDDQILQQPIVDDIDELPEKNQRVEDLSACKSGNDSRTMQLGSRDDSRVILPGGSNVSMAIPQGGRVDSVSNQLERGDGSRTLRSENRDDLRAAQRESVDVLRVFQSEEQNPSTEENCPSDIALSQDTGEGAEAFYQTNPECTNGIPFFLCPQSTEDIDGTEEEQAAFVRELENFFKERNMEFKAPKFYGEGLNCLKLWRAVTRLGGYEQVTSCKLWRQVGESFKPPKTCTTVSWSFRGFYEKALLDYERHKLHGGGLPVPANVETDVLLPVGGESQPCATQVSGSGRARRDAAARAMQGWHSQRLLGNGEVGDPIIKDKSSISLTKREKQLKSIGMLKRKKTSTLERAVKAARTKGAKAQMDAMVVDVGPQADWVKVNVHKTRDCFEVYALVPGLLREEVRVQCDPAGRLVISGEPEQPDNPWGVTPFKKVISLPSRIDSHQTSAVVTLHGQLFVRVPFEQSDL